MKYFFDTEFLGETQTKRFLGIPYGKTNNTIDLISIGIVSAKGKEYYAISKDFNLREAWNRFERKQDKSNSIYPAEKVYWIRENILVPIYIELFNHHCEIRYNSHFTKPIIDTRKLSFTYNNLKWLISLYGKSNKKIANEIEWFIDPQIEEATYQERWLSDKEDIQIYGYYPAYDWVVFCWLYDGMLKLPKGFPKYCIDLKQLLDNKVESLRWLTNDLYIRSIKHVGRHESHEKDRFLNFKEKLTTIKGTNEYPKETNAHNALSDAKWNYQLYNFIKSI